MKKLYTFLVVALCAALSFAKPTVVGLVDICRTNTLCGVGSEYADAVYAAGAIPYVLPATTNAASIPALLDRVDMVLFCGGEDFEPSRYGETNHPNLGKVNLRRDAWEFALSDEAIRRRLPLLGVCRGCQFLNIRFGGTLWQDLPSEKDGAKVHRIKGEHEITVKSGTCLSKLVGAASTSVNSRHHQAVKDLAKGFRISAVSPDGVVEAIEGTDYPALGVQFHPESLFARSGRREFLPLFRGDFTAIDPAKRPSSPNRRLVAIPDYCPTNRQVVAKANMVDALDKAGFVSVVIPFTDDDAKLESALADADALMVAGGIGPLQDYPKRCAFEHRAIRIALRRGIPISGVCHGSQIINTYFGGTLKLTPQMTDKDKDPLIRHRTPVTVPYIDNFHLVDLEPGSRIARVLGSSRAVINSSHSNRSFEMGKGLKVTARAPDGVVEAFEHESLPVMAFQFHPERMAFDARFIDLLRVSLSPTAP